MTATKATMSLWNRFADFDNFLLAWQRIANVSSRMINNDLGSEIFTFNLHENLRDLVAKVNNEVVVYQPQPDNKVYVPIFKSFNQFFSNNMAWAALVERLEATSLDLRGLLVYISDPAYAGFSTDG